MAVIDFVKFLHAELTNLNEMIENDEEVEQSEFLVERLTDVEALYYDFVKSNKTIISSEKEAEETEEEASYYLFATWLYLEQQQRGKIPADEESFNFDNVQTVTEDDERIDNAFFIVGMFEQHLEDMEMLDDEPDLHIEDDDDDEPRH
ncbi:hypothetical protein [Piscirickettsia salmonis]|uniref:hypothetical protein n=1 Tax=Piscirickettsia salmonis TaxID=1238 RepID=UPI0002F29159|nr:hypothetical protein [Piscirickettsia salmonis]AKP74701.1 hypothetical protein PSLF89_3207 [Piscirickettsia salmonis LF-89 = ATCC VR-1361]ALY01616.1 hypothetical protein AWE47_00955 [Piscirickettsia salmonis]AMA41128.1 hypothetical protein AWJ11_00950 [Piscirickettsia salmonis]AOS36317.1 hypothetical protein AVM72_13945 [Piscirickettsia salmonis]APS61009.1 hypothetical protein AVI53_10905 [Piscirickettsia salmonis]